jgi:hypothetical protein
MVWPPDYGAEFTRRKNLIVFLKNHPNKRAEAQALYKTSPIDWIEDWVSTYNPRNSAPTPKKIPFLLFPKQKEFIGFLQDLTKNKESGLVEKCRDIGATWLCAAFSVWLWLYDEGAAIGWGSRKAELVDELGDPDSIFEKIRIIIRDLPWWMLPRGFNMRDNCHYMKCINPETGASITGEAGDNIGRGGRKTIYFKDESAHYEHPETIEAALGDNTDVQIDISSVNGTANVFYARRMAGELWTDGHAIASGVTRVFIFDWRDHPGKTQDWYDKRKKKYLSEGLSHIFAQEVDRDYTSAIEGIIIPPEWVRAAVDAHKKLNIPATGLRRGGVDIADEGRDKNAMAVAKGIVLTFGESWGQGDTGATARKAVLICFMQGIDELYYDCIGVGAGFKAETNRLRDEKKLPARLKVYPWSASHEVLDKEENIIPGDTQSPKNEDYFQNFKAQAWWRTRIRFYKTYEAVMHGAYYPADELISLDSKMPNLQQIMRELSQATHDTNTLGKIIVEKKPDGAASPNLADAVVQVYNPLREVNTFDVL